MIKHTCFTKFDIENFNLITLCLTKRTQQICNRILKCSNFNLVASSASETRVPGFLSCLFKYKQSDRKSIRHPLTVLTKSCQLWQTRNRFHSDKVKGTALKKCDFKMFDMFRRKQRGTAEDRESDIKSAEVLIDKKKEKKEMKV